MGQPKLNFLSDDRLDLIRGRKLKEGFDSIKSTIKDMEIETQVERPAAPAPEPSEPRYTKNSLSDMARRLYNENIRPVVDEPEAETTRVPSTYANRIHGKALARALTGMRNPDNGDDGQYAPPAGPNGGNETNPTSNYAALTTSMTLEEYEDYINKKFLVEDEEEVEEVVQEPEFLAEKHPAVTELEDRLVEMDDITWVAIDGVMRTIARQHDLTPKQLHKEFKEEHGMIPDDWAKENQVTEECGWMPLDEAVVLNKVGQVFEVTYMYRCVTKRVKFFWPQVDYPTQKDMEDVVGMLYPGAKVLAFYPSTHCGDNKDNFMVLVGPSTPRAVVMKKEDWEPMTNEESLAYEMIATEEGNPISPPLVVDGGIELLIEDYDTGEERVVLITEGLVDNEDIDVKTRFKTYLSAYTDNEILEGKRGLWDNIHAKRKRGEKPAKPGDKGYPKTLNVEGLEQARKNVGASTCWDGYTAKGTKKKNGKTVPNCVKSEDYIPEDMSGMSQKSGDKRSTDSGAGMTAKGVAKYNRRTGGNLKTAVTTPPSKLKAGSKAANRRKSFCARSRSWNGETR